MPDFKNFSYKNVNVIYGILELEGFADGDDVVTIETTVDQFTKLVGAKGDVARSQTADNSCTVTIKLLQTSKSNKLLNVLFLADKLSGAGVLPMVINDKEINETYAISNAWIVKQPTVVRGQNVNITEWVFEGDNMIPILL